MQKDIHQTWFFRQSPREVWKYLTKPELIERWLAKTDFKPVVGHQFQFMNTCETDDGIPNHTYCQVLEIIPDKQLSYSWRKGKNDKAITIDSVVTWTLTEKDGGTELQLRHSGFTLLEDMLAHTNGWHECLDKIIQLVNTATHANTNA